MTELLTLQDTGETFYVPTFEIMINERPADRLIVRDLTEVSYEDSIDAIDSFTLAFNNWDTDQLRPHFVGQDASTEAWEQVQPGNRVELRMGYQGELRLMTTGFFTTLDVDFPETGFSKATVRGLNVLDRFRDKQYSWSWPDTGTTPMTDSEIAESLGVAPDSPAGHPGLNGIARVVISPEAAGLEVAQDHVFMINEYPIRFLIRLARRNGYEVVLRYDVDGEPELVFGPSDQIPDPTYVLEWGKTLSSLKATISTVRQVKKVTVFGWNRTTKQTVRGEASVEADGGSLTPTIRSLALASGREEVVVDHVVSTDQQARQKALQILGHLASQLIEVEGAVIGLPGLRAGRTVRLERLGEQLTGSYFVTWTRHVINDSGYRTAFKARLEGPQQRVTA